MPVKTVPGEINTVLLDPIKYEFVDCLSQQISELDLLKSMYPNDGEITLAEKGILNKINDFLSGDSDYVPNNLEYIINLIIETFKIEVCVNLPLTYPHEIPDVSIRCNQLNRQQESNINTDLTSYIKTNHLEEVCVYTAITWLQDNIGTIVKNQDVETVKNLVTDERSLEQERFTRLWIYSHHIYSKKKRDEISQKSKELKLSGFCLPGKPGVICVEGDESACKEWWQHIKSMKWKKITMRKTETYESNEKSNLRKFDHFNELNLNTTTAKQDMSAFSKFMSKHGCSYIFSELFGLD